MDENQIKELSEEGYDILETHISWILFSKEHAYKIKKPVKFSFLDFSTLKKRKHCCEEEVRLNTRLAPDLYMGVVPIGKRGDRIFFEENTEVLGYAVKMRKLTDGKRMDILLGKNKVTKEHILELAGTISQFHGKVDTIKENKYGSADIIEDQINDLANFKNIIETASGLGYLVDYMLEQSGKFIKKNSSVFKKRQDTKIKDCHGDLHSANIFITEKITVFDCIEFNKDFRFIDVASEIAFMAMDLDSFGKKNYSELFVEEYISKTNDNDLLLILDFYKCYRANVRAKIAAIDYSQNYSEDSVEKIAKYLKLAEEYAKNLL